MFDRLGVCWDRYQTIEQLVRDDPECSPANPMFSAITQPGVGETIAAGIPLDFSARGRLPAAPAPRLGEHAEQVLHELLGMPAAEFVRLHDKGVVR